MGWVLFVLYFISMGFIGTSYRFYILDERHTNPNIVKKRERLKDIEEQLSKIDICPYCHRPLEK